MFDQYQSLATSTLGIDRAVFERCLGPVGAEKNLITQRMFDFFDQNADNYISFEEFIVGLSVLTKGTMEEKMTCKQDLEHFLSGFNVVDAFRGYDLDGNGLISRMELKRMLTAYFHISMELVRDVVRTLEDEIISDFDENSSKPVSAAFTASIPENVTNSNAQPTSPKEHWPVMEQMSVEAIDEMVEKLFASVGADSSQGLSFEHFQQLVSTDTTIMAWFESLGKYYP